MTPRRCFDCGARAADGADVRECASCAFDYCNDHAATVGGVTKCEECRDVPAGEGAMADDRNGDVRKCAAILRRLACIHVQGMPESEIRPFDESYRVEGWKNVARALLREIWHMAKPGALALEHVRLFNGKDGMPEWDAADDEMRGMERFLVNVGRIEVALNIPSTESPYRSTLPDAAPKESADA